MPTDTPTTAGYSQDRRAAGESAGVPGIYDDPAAYELAFADRDISGECDAALDLAARALGRPARSALELGAGPALHSRQLARRGLRAVALDIRPGAVDYLRRVAPEVEGFVGDMRTTVLAEPVDLVLCPLGGFAYLLDDDAALEALATAQRNVVPGGSLLLELLPIDAHRPAPTRWEVRRGEVTVVVEAGPTRWVGAEVYEWELALRWIDAAGEQVAAEPQRQRYLPAPTTERLLRRAGWTNTRLYDGWDPRRPWRGELSYVAAAVRAAGR